jgi:HAE1 family hydrophobic/amphiphilic exporter-1
MKIASFSVHRPVFITMTVLIAMILGAISLLRLPIDLMPDVTSPTISVVTTYENAGAEEIEELITRPLEEAVSAVPGVDKVTSTSIEGTSQVRVSFNWGTDLDAAANDIRDRLDRISNKLPDDADRPMLRKFDLASFPILILGIASRLNPIEIRQIIEDQVQYRIERIPGVASLEIFGGLAREIHVLVYPDKIKALGLSLDKVVEKIRAGNVTLPAGQIDQGNVEITIRTQGEYVSLEQLRDTVVATDGIQMVRLREVASVVDAWQKVRQIVRINGETGMRLAIQKQSGTNTVKVAREVLTEVGRINEDIPQIKIVPIIDTSEYIERSITNVGSSAMNGAILTILVLLLFLRNIRSTAIISSSIPISIIATFVLIYFNNFTLNLVSLGGLALGVGMMVDNSIVVLENICRLYEGGMEPKQAAILGTEEVIAPIIASTLTTVAVFFPLIFVRGIAGVLFQQLAYVVTFALLCSLWVALTLVPMLTAQILKPHGEKTRKSWRDWVFRWSGYLLDALDNSYKQSLALSLNYPKSLLLLTVVMLAATFFLVPYIGVEAMPQTDEGEVRVNVEMDVATRIEVLSERFKLIEEIVAREVPEKKNVVTSLGGSGYRPGSVYTGEMRIVLKSLGERSRSSEKVAIELRGKLNKIPGITVRTQAGQGLPIMRRVTGEGGKISIQIRGHDLDIGDKIASQLKDKIANISGVADIKLSREVGNPEQVIIVNRAKAANVKLSVAKVAGMLQIVLGGTQASSYREAGNEYRILVKLHNAEQKELRDLLDLVLLNEDGEPVILRNVVDIEDRRGPARIQREDQERVTSLDVNIAGRDMGAIIRDIREILSSVPVAENFSIVFGGDYEDQQKAFSELLLGFLLSLVLVYMVMACQYESLHYPFVVMFSVPISAIGVILILFLTDTTFNIQSFIGCIMLGGIVVNSAIILVDHINLLRNRDKFLLCEAIEEAGRRRLRPILMTALTTIIGLIPLALGIGEGAEAQAAMARVVVGGLVSSTVITLFLVPVIYYLAERVRTARLSRNSLDTTTAPPDGLLV